MAPVMLELQKNNIEYNFIFLAEHKETMASMIKMFGLKKPDIVLGNLDKDITNIVTMGFWSFKVLLSALYNKKKIFKNDKKGIVLVHGDAPPAFLGALIGNLSGIKVGHVESGLRSFNLFNPFPEEINRLLTFKLTDYYFCPDHLALNNLRRYNGKKINTRGNTLIDSLRLALKNKNKIKVKIPKESYAIVTTHRFENIFKKRQFESIIEIVEDISKKIKLLFILHPPTKKKLMEFGFMDRLIKNENIELRPRYNYFEFIKLIDKSEFLISDGGSNQEECFYLGKPCLILRNETERKEGLGKNAVLSKFNKKIIEDFVKDYKDYKKQGISEKISPSKIIVNEIKRFK